MGGLSAIALSSNCFRFIFISGVWVSSCTCVPHACISLETKGVKPPGTGIAGVVSCYVGAENTAWIL